MAESGNLPRTHSVGGRAQQKGNGGRSEALIRVRNGRRGRRLGAGGGRDAGARAGGGKKPNIVFIMGDDIGIMQPGIYHRGLMVGETPNIDRIGHEGGIFMTYYAEESCTAGRNAFFTGMHPLRTGMIPPQLPGSPSYLRPGTPALAWFLWDQGYTPESSARTISVTIPTPCRPRTGSTSTGATCITWTPCKA